MGKIDKAGAAQRQRAARGIGKIRQGEAIRRHPLQIGLDVNLAHRAAEDDDMGHPRHRQQRRLHHPFGLIAQRERRKLVRHQTDLEQVHGAGDERRQARGVHPRRQGTAQFAQAFGNALARGIEIDPVGELDSDDRQAWNGFGTDGGQAGCAIDSVLDRLGDQLLHLLGGEAGRFGLDVGAGRHEFRKHVQRCGLCRPHTQRQRDQGQGRDGACEAHAQINEPAHAYSSASVLGLSSRARSRPAPLITMAWPG